MSQASTRGPLADISVIELGGIGPTPFAGMLLADLGARVVRIHRTTETAAPNPVLDRGRRSLAAPGQDTQAILADLGHTSGDIERLLAEGVVRVTDPISRNGPK